DDHVNGKAVTVTDLGLDLLGEPCGILSRRTENRVAGLNVGPDVLEPQAAQQAHEVGHRERIDAADVDTSQQRDVSVRHRVINPLVNAWPGTRLRASRSCRPAATLRRASGTSPG